MTFVLHNRLMYSHQVLDRLRSVEKIRDIKALLADSLGTRESALKMPFHNLEHHVAHMVIISGGRHRLKTNEPAISTPLARLRSLCHLLRAHEPEDFAALDKSLSKLRRTDLSAYLPSASV